MTDAWHYAWNGERFGPEPRLVIEDLIRAGRIKAETLVWAAGMAQWEPAEQHFAFGAPALPPEIPADAGGKRALYSGAPARGLVEAVRVCFARYATFRGRASRSEYWYFTLFLYLANIILMVLESGMGADGQALSALFGIATFLPSLSVTWRRLHDTDHSGWWIGGGLIALSLVGGIFGFIAAKSGSEPGMSLAVVGGIMGLGIVAYSIVLLVFLCQRGMAGPNRFG